MYYGRLAFFLTFLCCMGLRGYGQGENKELAQEYLRLAEIMMKESQAENDIREILAQAADLDPENDKANFEAGHYHLLTVGKDLAVQYFMRVYERTPNYRFDLEYWIGKSYQYGLQFEKALEFYNKYREKAVANPSYRGSDKKSIAEVDRSINECFVGMDFIANPGNYAIINAGREINSEWEDYAPVLNEAEDEMIFTSRRKDGNLNDDVAEDNKPYEDIFISRKVNGVWSPAENIGTTVNTKFHDSNIGLSADGRTLFIYEDSNGGDIYYSTLQPNGKWSSSQPLPGVINSGSAENSVSLSRDGRTLFFSSNRPGGMGGLDLYMATKNDRGEWENVRNLGPKINTNEDEDGPFIDYDGHTLYFSSKGHTNMGGFDIFKSVFDPDTNEWSEPENLGYPINTPDNDIFYVVSADGKRAYYSSVREDAIGYDDIYIITVPEPREPENVEEPAIKPLTFVVKTVDINSGESLQTKVTLQGQQDNVIVAGTEIGPGVMQFQLTSAEAKAYRLSVELEGYIFQNLTIDLPAASAEEQTINRTVYMRKLQAGVSSVLRNIYFDYDKATFKTESFNELNKLERMMRQNTNLRVEISGHTDNFGSAAYNMKLSQKRAQAVKDFLVSKGIDPRRVTVRGYGETRPLASNDDEKEGRELNRRVEFKVL